MKSHLTENIKAFSYLQGQKKSNFDNAEFLENGDEIFKSMLESIARANKYVFLETFIFWNGEIAKKFTKLICKKSKQGVDCRIILDSYGSKKIDKKLIQMLKKSYVKVYFYNPFNLKNFISRRDLNQRTHRKILIVDGISGHIGGVGIADEWNGDAKNSSEWRDIHLKIRGTVVRDLLITFFEHWKEFENINEKDVNLLTKKKGSDEISSHCTLVSTSGNKPINNINEYFTYLFTSATKTIKIITPYFIPSKEILKKLAKVINEDVCVEIIIPSPIIDEKIALLCSQYYWKKYCKIGIKIYRYNKTFNHSKLVIIDNSVVSLGSTNMDYRSLITNEETNISFYSKEIVTNALNIFEKDKAKSEIVTHKTISNFNNIDRIKQFFASLFYKYL